MLKNTYFIISGLLLNSKYFNGGLWWYYYACEASSRRYGGVAQKRDGSFQTGRVIGLSLSHFINDIYTSFLSPLLPLLIRKLSMSLDQAGFLSTILQIPSLLNPYIGILADRISVRYFIYGTFRHCGAGRLRGGYHRTALHILDQLPARFPGYSVRFYAAPREVNMGSLSSIWTSSARNLEKGQSPARALPRYSRLVGSSLGRLNQPIYFDHFLIPSRISIMIDILWV